MKKLKENKRALIILITFFAFAVCLCFFKNINGHTYKQAVYIYLCGSTLEYNNGAAAENIREILNADISNDTAVVIETGGCKGWSDYDIPDDSICRYIVKNGRLIKKEKLPNSSMGEEATLEDYLDFCNKNYPAEKTALILWDHGNTDGVCYDQNYDFDRLHSGEIVNAFSETSSHFDLIGFDACLMSEYDYVTGLSEYADYMIASEEIEPVGGWDYISFLEAYDTGDDIESVGKTICDSYFEKCKRNDNSEISVLALTDLKKASKLSKAFDACIGRVKQKAEEAYGNFEVISAIEYTSKLGANGKYEGYSNLIDLKSFSEYFEENSNESKTLSDAVDDIVIYKVSGDKRKNCGGISLYYPLNYTEEQYSNYIKFCTSEGYKDYLNMLYSEIPETTIKFEDDGSKADDGSFQIRLTQESKKYVKSVEFYLLGFVNEENNEMAVSKLGADNDIFKDWNNMTFHSNFRGIWLGLDGHQLCYTISECNEKQIIFQSPVVVNDKVTNLRFSFTFDDDCDGGGYYDVIGLWDGIDENGLPSKQVTPLKKGDTVTVLKKCVSLSDYSTYYDKSDVFIIGDECVVSEIPLSDKYYQYAYVVSDIFGNTFYSKSAGFEMKYSKERLEENPLQDGEYAADIIYIDNVDNELVYNNIK